MTKRVLIVGANGMLGSSIFRFLSRLSEYEVLGSVRSDSVKHALAAQGFENVISGIDALSDEQLSSICSSFKPDFLINCVGVIKQLDSSKLPLTSIELNSLLPHRLALLADKFDARLVHFSTDCIFSGNQGMYTEDDLPDARDLYGRSKLLGEVDYSNHITLRTSIIGHELTSNISLIDWFMSQQDTVKGFSNAIFSGLPTVYVAEFLHRHIFDSDINGLYNLSVDPINKYQLLKLVKRVYNKDIQIERFDAFNIDRSLDSTKLRQLVGFTPLSWEILIEKMHDEYKQYFQP